MSTQRGKKPKTVLQEMFLKRVREEMGALSVNELARRPGAPRQSTFNEVMNGADPRLETVYRIAVALNIAPWELFLDRADVVRLRTKTDTNVSKVTQLPGYPSMLGNDGNSPNVKKPLVRKSRTR